MPSPNSPQSFKQIKQKTPETFQFHFFIVLQDCVCDVIFKWKWGWKPTKWRRPSCSNSRLWNGISRELFGALRSVIARFFAFFTLFNLSLTFFRPEFPFNNSQRKLAKMAERFGCCETFWTSEWQEEWGKGKKEPVGMAKDFDFQMLVIYVMYDLTV